MTISESDFNLVWYEDKHGFKGILLPGSKCVQNCSIIDPELGPDYVKCNRLREDPIHHDGKILA